jgi:predicted amidohydrolase
MIVAAVQMTSGPDVAANLEAARYLLARCAEAGAVVAVLPENFAFMGLRDADKLKVAEEPGAGPIQEALARVARDLGLWVVGGTLPLRVPGESRAAAASLLFDASGGCVARYDKIHLFDVDIPGKPESYRESAQVAPGASVVVVDTPAGRLGMAVCYDVRFPELFRAMLARGAEWFALPAAFTVPTGRAHWDLLLRARAVENLAPVVAAAQTGFHPGGRETYGHSLVVDHWGEVLARRPRGPGVVVAAIDPDAQRRARREFPALDHRRI